MVKRPLTLREKPVPETATELPVADLAVAEGKPEPEVLNPNTQKRRQELGRYWLQVDRQTKRSYKTEEEAEAAGTAIKKKFSQVQVAIYDRDESVNRIIEVPA